MQRQDGRRTHEEPLRFEHASERPRAKLRAIRLNEAETVEVRNARAGVDVPAVGDALDMLHGLMPEHKRTQPRHGAAPVPTAGLGRSEPENHIVDDRRRCVLKPAQRLGP